MGTGHGAPWRRSTLIGILAPEVPSRPRAEGRDGGDRGGGGISWGGRGSRTGWRWGGGRAPPRTRRGRPACSAPARRTPPGGRGPSEGGSVGWMGLTCHPRAFRGCFSSLLVQQLCSGGNGRQRTRRHFWWGSSPTERAAVFVGDRFWASDLGTEGPERRPPRGDLAAGEGEGVGLLAGVEVPEGVCRGVHQQTDLRAPGEGGRGGGLSPEAHHGSCRMVRGRPSGQGNRMAGHQPPFEGGWVLTSNEGPGPRHVPGIGTFDEPRPWPEFRSPFFAGIDWDGAGRTLDVMTTFRSCWRRPAGKTLRWADCRSGAPPPFDGSRSSEKRGGLTYRRCNPEANEMVGSSQL